MDISTIYVEELTLCVQSVEIEYLLQHKKPLTNSNKQVRKLCCCIYKILTLGLKNDNLGIWNYIKEFCSKDIISRVENVQNNSISQMKKYFLMDCSWLCIVLNEALLEIFFENFSKNETLEEYFHINSIMASDKKKEVKSIIKNLDKLKFQLDIRSACFKTPEHIEAAERLSDISKLELSEANAYALLNNTVSQLSSAAYDTGSKIMSFINENTAMLSGSSSQSIDLKQNVFISNEELKAESDRTTPFNDVEISCEPIQVERCLMPSKSKRLKQHLKKDISVNCQSDVSETSSDISSNIKEIEPDNEMVAKEPDDEMVAKEPDNEMVAKELDSEMVAKEPDNEMAAKEPDNEMVAKEPDDEMVAKEPDNEMAAKEPDNEMVAKEPDNDMAAKELDSEMVAKEPDNEMAAKEPDNEMVAKEPDNDMAAKEPDNQMVAKELDSEMVAKEPDNEMVDKEPDNEMVANEPDNEMVDKEPDDEMVAKEPDNEMVAKEPDNEMVAKEPDNEIVAKEPDDEMVAKEPDNEVVSKEANNEMVANEPDNEMVAKEPDSEMVAKEPDNEMVAKEPDDEDLSSTNNEAKDKIMKQDTVNKRRLVCDDITKNNLEVIARTTHSKDILIDPVKIYMKVNILKSMNELILKFLQIPGSSTRFTNFYLLFTDQYLYVLKKSKEMSIFFTEFLHLSYDEKNVDFLINEEGLVLFSDDHFKYFRVNFENENDKNDIVKEISCHFKPKDSTGQQHSVCLKKFLTETLELATDIQISFYKQISWLYHQSKDEETLQYQTSALMYKGRNIFGIKWFRFYLVSEDGILYHYVDQTSNKPENSWLMTDCSSCQLHDCEVKLNFKSSEQQPEVRIRFSDKQEAFQWYERLKDQMTKMFVAPDEEVVCSLVIVNDYLVILGETFPFQCKCFASCKIHQYLNYISSDDVYQFEFTNSKIWKIKFRNLNYDKQLFEELIK